MGTLGTALVGSRSSDATCAVEPPTITPGWEDGNRARRWAEKSLFDRVLGSLFSDQRRHPRFFAPPIVAYLGGVGSSKLFPIVNVSVSGFCLRANEFWTPGAVMPVTLQRWRTIPQDDPESITVHAMLVRRDGDAAGFAIAMAPGGSLLLPHMGGKRAKILQEQMAEFLKDLPEPMKKAPVEPHHAALCASVVRKAERLELLLR
jgi:hypothetical protein